MKKAVKMTWGALLAVCILTGCAKASGGNELKKIVVGATPSPHAEILNSVKEDMREKGYDLVVKEFVEYIQPNVALANEELDANFMQHQPYLEDYNKNNQTTLIPVAKIHFEPLGLYPGKTKSLDALQDGAVIAVPNDTTNEARALLLLQDLGLITLKEGVGLQAGPKDIADNPKNIEIKELESAQIARSLPDVDFGVINGNNALLANLNVNQDAVAKEGQSSLAAETYQNIIAVRSGDQNRDDIKVLVGLLQAQKARNYMAEKYNGAVVPVSE